ncbi:MAG: hypothetical protein ACREYF_06715 [Gammaproteobacteria bacterium]
MAGEIIPIGRNWIRELEVTDEILEKLWNKHRVVLDEVIECLLGYTIRHVKPGDNSRLYIYGRSEGGRYLFVVLERLAPMSFFLLSARSMPLGERRKYGKALKKDP